MAKCLIIEAEGHIYEIHMLNPRETLSGFGGSRTGLVVGKTASLVVRDRSPMGQVDTEYDIHDPNVWKMLAKVINHDGFVPVAKVPG